MFPRVALTVCGCFYALSFVSLLKPANVNARYHDRCTVSTHSQNDLLWHVRNNYGYSPYKQILLTFFPNKPSRSMVLGHQTSRQDTEQVILLRLTQEMWCHLSGITIMQFLPLLRGGGRQPHRNGAQKIPKCAEFSIASTQLKTFEKRALLTNLFLVDYFHNPEALSTIMGLSCYYHKTGLDKLRTKLDNNSRYRQSCLSMTRRW
jgi:hypothetical protein